MHIAAPLEWQTKEHFEKTLNVNLYGAIMITKSFLPLLRESKGRLINMSSVASMVAFPGVVAYNVSKSALEAYTDTFRYRICLGFFFTFSFFLRSYEIMKLLPLKLIIHILYYPRTLDHRKFTNLKAKRFKHKECKKNSINETSILFTKHNGLLYSIFSWNLHHE